MRDDRDEHVGMSVPAELEALALEGPGLVRLDPYKCGVPRHCVLLAPEVRHPERVDDVLCGQLELDLLTNRDIELLAGLEGRPVLELEGRRVGIREVPRPLAALDLHGHGHVAVDVVDEVQPVPREGRERDDHERRHDGPDELESVRAVDLLRYTAGPVAELDARIGEGADHDREHDDCAREQDPVDEGDRFGLRPARVERPGPHRHREED